MAIQHSFSRDFNRVSVEISTSFDSFGTTLVCQRSKPNDSVCQVTLLELLVGLTLWAEILSQRLGVKPEGTRLASLSIVTAENRSSDVVRIG